MKKFIGQYILLFFGYIFVPVISIVLMIETGNILNLIPIFLLVIYNILLVIIDIKSVKKVKQQLKQLNTCDYSMDAKTYYNTFVEAITILSKIGYPDYIAVTRKTLSKLKEFNSEIDHGMFLNGIIIRIDEPTCYYLNKHYTVTTYDKSREYEKSIKELNKK